MVNLNLSYILRSYILLYPASEDVVMCMAPGLKWGCACVRTAAEAGGSGCACADVPLREVDRAMRSFGREVTCCDGAK